VVLWSVLDFSARAAPRSALARFAGSNSGAPPLRREIKHRPKRVVVGLRGVEFVAVHEKQ